jgi:hypothetical protein
MLINSALFSLNFAHQQRCSVSKDAMPFIFLRLGPISYMFFFPTSIAYLAALDVISSVFGLQSNFRPALQSTKRLIFNAIYFDYYVSASTAPWVLTRGGASSAY